MIVSVSFTTVGDCVTTGRIGREGVSSRNLTGEDCECGAMKCLVLVVDSLIPQVPKARGS
jgi:hypothetical protein